MLRNCCTNIPHTEHVIKTSPQAQNPTPVQKLWHEVPKFHYVWHIIFQSRIANPRFNWCYPDEDFMRVLKARLLLNAYIKM